MAAPKSRAGLRFGTGETSRRTGIHDLSYPVGEMVLDLGEIDDHPGPESGREPGRGRWRISRLDRPALVPPFGQAAIEDRHPVMSEDPEQEPGPGGAQVGAGAVVHHDSARVSDAEASHDPGEAVGRRQHVGQGRIRIADLVQVEIDRTRNVGRDELGTRVAPAGRKVPAGIDDADIGGSDLAGKPVGGNDGGGLLLRPGAHAAREASTKRENSCRIARSWSTSDSGCHCTPTMNWPLLVSSPSMSPSGATALATSPGASRFTPW